MRGAIFLVVCSLSLQVSAALKSVNVVGKIKDFNRKTVTLVLDSRHIFKLSRDLVPKIDLKKGMHINVLLDQKDFKKVKVYRKISSVSKRR